MGTITGYSSAPTYVKIASSSLSGLSSVTFSNIPQGYTDLILVTNSQNVTTSGYPYLRFNGDSGSNYSTTYIVGNGSTASSSRYSSVTELYLSNNISGSLTTNFSYNCIANLQSYSNSNTNKTVISREGNTNGAEASIGVWRNTSPITSILFAVSGGTFASGSTVTLYGIKAATTEVFGRAKASGGDSIVTDGTYIYHTFKTSGIFTPFQSLTCDYLVVAGGGGGGTRGAGGAGGYRSATAVAGISTPISVTVGGGGSINTNGSDSIFSITSTGGGKGATSTNAGNGGSGGGGYNDGATTFTAGTGNTPSTSPSQGNNGGAGGGADRYTGGGGGGAGAAGSAGQSGSVPRAGGAGGIGSNAHSSWLPVFNLGSSGYLAGGGGGGGDTGGAGGLGGGGKGADAADDTAAPGSANSGGGGGAGRSGSGVAKAGGSGVVIVRYAI